PPCHGGDGGTQPEPAGRQCRRGEQDPRIRDLPAHALLAGNVIPDEQRIPAGLLGATGNVGEDAGRRGLPEGWYFNRIPHARTLPPATDKTGSSGRIVVGSPGDVEEAFDNPAYRSSGRR